MAAERETLDEYFGVLKRRWKIAAIVGSATMLVFAIITFALPAVYQSDATLQIQRADLPAGIESSGGISFTEERLQAVKQRVLSVDRVAALIQKHSLYTGSDPAEFQDAVDKFRESTIVEPAITNAVDPDSLRTAALTFAFIVSYQSDDPLVARNVTQSLAEQFVTESSALQNEASSRTVTFLKAEAERLRKSLIDTEGRLAAFKKQYGASLPDNRLASLGQVQDVQRELGRIDDELRTARSQKLLLETKLADIPRYRAVLSDSGDPLLQGEDRLAAAQRELVALQAKYSDDHPSVIRLKREIASLSGGPTQSPVLDAELQSELQAKEAELSAARERYKPDHPTVVQLAQTVQALRQKVQANARPVAPVATPNPTNPAYLELQAQIESADLEIRELSARRGSYYAQLSSYEQGLTEAPQVEKDYNNLVRDYELTQAEYKDIRSRQTAAELTQKAAGGEEFERYIIVDPPHIPDTPIKPDRLALLFLGLVLALAAALAGAAIGEAADRSVRGSRDIRELLGTAPLASIPAFRRG